MRRMDDSADAGRALAVGHDRLECVTWNIHRAQGGDGRVDPARILRVLAEEVVAHGPDLLTLQEADQACPPHAGLLDLGRIEAETGLRPAQDATSRWGPLSHGFLGTVVLLRPEAAVLQQQVIDLPGHCHRGAVVLDLVLRGRRVRVVATHLSLSQPLRAVQMRVIGQVLFRLAPMQTVLLGDLNEWRPWGGLALARPLVGRRFHGPARATFPVGRPLLPLDRILSDVPGAVSDAQVLDGPGIRAASDHRPLRASVRLARP